MILPFVAIICVLTGCFYGVFILAYAVLFLFAHPRLTVFGLLIMLAFLLAF